MRHLPRLPRHLPDRGLSRTLPARCAALHFLSHHRAQGSHRIASSAQAMGNRIYGCDDCLAVCPWNKFAQAASEAKLVARDDLRAPRLARAAAARRCGIPHAVHGSPVKRIGRDRFIRNVLIAAGNSGDDRPDCRMSRRCCADASPLVRAMAVWALSQLASPNCICADCDAHIAASRADADVPPEWETT